MLSLTKTLLTRAFIGLLKILLFIRRFVAIQVGFVFIFFCVIFLSKMLKNMHDSE